jgi:DNA-binding beta-propeller fold protein YncE
MGNAMSRNLPIAFALLAVASLAAPARAQFVPGDLYVSDGWNHHIYRVEPGTWKVTTFADANDGLDGPSGLLLSRHGTLLCSSYWNAEIVEFDSQGSGSVLYDSSDGLDGPFGENGLAYDAAGDLYVSDYNAQAILRFPAGGGAATVFADASDGIGRPDGLAFAANGDLYVANRDTHDVLKIDSTGSAGVFDTLPDEPMSIVIRGNGDVYVATHYTGEIYRYPGGDPAQRYVLATMSTGGGNPGMALSLDGTSLYFTSNGTGNLDVVDADSGAKTEVIGNNGLPGALAIGVIPRSAKWSNYGSGLAGTNGVPSFTSRNDPILGRTITLDLGNSWGQPTSGLIALGFQQASLHTGLGSDLLLIPALLVPITFSYGADSFPWSIPNDPALFGLELDLQAVEADPGAVKGVSFTQGLQLLLGS